MQRGLGEIRRRDYCLQNLDLDPGGASSSLCFDPRLATLKEDQQAPLGPGTFHGDSEETLDQPGKHHLTRNRLRRFHNGLDIQLPDWRVNRGRRHGSSSLMQARVQPVEMFYFSVGSPASIALPRIPEIGVSECIEATSGVEARGDLIGERFIVDKAIRAGRTDRPFVQLNGIESSSFDARNFCPDQCGAIFEILRAKFGTNCQLFVMSSE